jgi:PLP dependent protein
MPAWILPCRFFLPFQNRGISLFHDAFFTIFDCTNTRFLLMSIADNISRLRNEIPSHVKLIAVSKTMPVAALMEAYNCGQRIFGENKVQEMTEKQKLMPPDTEWHLIGHLQTNKVKFVVPYVKLIHSVDSLKLLAEINKEASRIDRVVDCLLQMYIAEEETKFGLSMDEVTQLLDSDAYKSFKNIRVNGLMGMATFTDNQNQVRKEFHALKAHFDTLKNRYFSGGINFRELSMGMSGDYPLAIEAGSTLVRIGSLIFGARNYNP